MVIVNRNSLGMNNFTSNKIQNWASRALSLTIELPFPICQGKKRHLIVQVVVKNGPSDLYEHKTYSRKTSNHQT